MVCHRNGMESSKEKKMNFEIVSKQKSNIVPAEKSARAHACNLLWMKATLLAVRQHSFYMNFRFSFRLIFFSCCSSLSFMLYYHDSSIIFFALFFFRLLLCSGALERWRTEVYAYEIITLAWLGTDARIPRNMNWITISNINDFGCLRAKHRQCNDWKWKDIMRTREDERRLHARDG